MLECVGGQDCSTLKDQHELLKELLVRGQKQMQMALRGDGPETPFHTEVQTLV